ncbi:hypothetical protein WMY93_006764 [Mugilogobius chulae]|uniref:C2H2-type domain-containing protein n=1 Tax=Mugilogobius chulae TaxID=88201 RepID=A0AAW0PWC8_9GOBI
MIPPDIQRPYSCSDTHRPYSCSEDEGAESDWSWDWEAAPKRTLRSRTMELDQDLTRYEPVSPAAPVAPVIPVDHQREDTNGHGPSSCSDPKPYSCNKCGKSFTRKLIFQKHILMHSTTNPQKCSHCGRVFKTKENLLQHRSICLRTCRVCERRFADTSLLRAHLQTHRPKKETQTKKPKLEVTLLDLKHLHSFCPVCQKLVPEKFKSHVKSHLKQHALDVFLKPYSCSVCGTKFRFRSSLKAHESTHSAERAHKCSFCAKAFRAPHLLKNHVRMHTGERPFSCSECGKSFTTGGF